MMSDIKMLKIGGDGFQVCASKSATAEEVAAFIRKTLPIMPRGFKDTLEAKISGEKCTCHEGDNTHWIAAYDVVEQENR